jgi:hypothetical protein
MYAQLNTVIKLASIESPNRIATQFLLDEITVLYSVVISFLTLNSLMIFTCTFLTNSQRRNTHTCTQINFL